MPSAARKRGVKIDENLFDLGSSASQGYGHDMGAGAVDIQTKPIIRSKPIDIFRIKPNPSQPRRLVPSAFRGGAVMAQIERWLTAVQGITGRELPLRRMIRGELGLRAADDHERQFQAALQELPLLRLADLAASIHQDGLSNPITVVKAGADYVIETGERRWVAYHLLHAYLDGDDYAAIPARRMTELSFWRQASENSARDNLNAIARARQIALLLMDLHGWGSFQPIDAFEHEQDFYAQVADSERWRIPYGKSEQLCQICGFENASRIRQFRALLRLTREQWTYADDHDLPEFHLRKWLRRPIDTPVTHPAADESALADDDASTIPAALKRCERHINQTQFDRLDDSQQLQAMEWMRTQIERMQDWAGED